jgi:hypothetical protein
MNDLHDDRPEHGRWRMERSAPPEPSRSRPDSRNAALVLVGMVCVTLVLISFACAWTFK